ncbi:unnamed protein product [Bursaphelenchus okinawaensis]|uniref:Serpentine receptor class gamma n=1 Tax=Bursaphelenchus okinawaensis TaxID=465554 RepID=A0A811KCR7_9BILA|nr:unnamed protein product [Bursaphelenchus okinawaensis]CAG9101097.1 unnamed protein product [Bursaphelenchus okinawaensis]
MLWFEAIYMLVYCIPLYLMCIRMLYILWRRRKHFQSPFYKIVLVSGVFDCIGITLHHFTNRLANTEFFIEYILPYVFGYHYWLIPVNYMAYHCLHSALLSSFLMAFNRLTSFLPFYYDKIWQYQKLIMYACFGVLPFCLVFYMLLNPAGFTHDDTQLWFSYVGFDYEKDMTFGIVDSVVTFYYYLIISVTTFGLNLCNVAMLIRLRQKELTKMNRERPLTYSAIVIFVVQLAVMAAYFMFTINFLNVYVWLRFVLSPVTETLYLTPSLIVVVYVPSLRKEVFRRSSEVSSTIAPKTVTLVTSRSVRAF